EKDPETAQKAISDFADYLRGNMDSLESSSPISFRAELSHVKYYLNLEQLRLGDELNVVYSLHAEDFSLPPLTVVTLVENAVKHGVAKAEDGGTVTISTWEGKDSYSVEIRDDGVGFDMEQHEKDDRTHIGIENVRTRLRVISGGELYIFSAPGEGTKAIIKIPKKGL
ncbi:MAG: histidine kinase, partial [Lachnospiraceae bacterium]|nr:histidine kinase [Lachnospiraceae bacterium]